MQAVSSLRPAAILLASAFGGLTTTVPASAQPLFGSAESIECTVINADTVVVGTLAKIGEGEEPDERGRRPATIAVEETLKGKHRQRIDVMVAFPPSMVNHWKDKSCRLLVAIGPPPVETRVIDLSDKELAILTMEFKVLRQPEVVIQNAKDAIRRMPGVKQIDTFTLLVPNELLVGTKWEDYHATTVTIPVDEGLEKRANELIGSENYQQREEGARALRYFKSDQNVAKASSLLNDPGWAYLRHPDENNGIEVRIYGVRREAYQTLKYWGVSAKKPTIREEIVRSK